MNPQQNRIKMIVFRKPELTYQKARTKISKEFTISKLDMEKQVKLINPKTATTSDSIPPKILKINSDDALIC